MKSARITRLLPLSLALMLAMFLTACGPSNTVRLLSPAPAVNPVLPAPNAPRVTVVPFTDNRQDTTNLGVRRDGSAFVASDDVAQWVSRGLADELRRQGVQVSYALDENQARSGNPDYIVTGTVERPGCVRSPPPNWPPPCAPPTAWPAVTGRRSAKRPSTPARPAAASPPAAPPKRS